MCSKCVPNAAEIQLGGYDTDVFLMCFYCVPNAAEIQLGGYDPDAMEGKMCV
jgi:hypothetical protein